MATTGAKWRMPVSCGVEANPLIAIALRSCLQRVRTWAVPPNWTGGEWMREVAALSDAAAHEACCQFDASRGAELPVFVMSRVMARMLTRYRQEWNFARRVTYWEPKFEDSSRARPAIANQSNDAGTNMQWSLLAALDQLHENDRWLMVQIFWHDRDQSELAKELGISQPAISKRYRTIVRKLRAIFAVAGFPAAAA